MYIAFHVSIQSTICRHISIVHVHVHVYEFEETFSNLFVMVSAFYFLISVQMFSGKSLKKMNLRADLKWT